MTQYFYGTPYADYQYGVYWDSNVMYGYGGNDTQVGNQYGDSLYGYDGNDSQYGYGGNDYLSGMGGYDYLNGGSGVDHLWGGTSRDSLVGGYDYSSDTFHFSQGHSNSSTAEADTIWDWNVAYDWIDMPIAGTSSNYGEAQTWWTTVEGAEYHVENTSLRYEDHVFLYNTGTDTGYLLSDLDRNFDFETCVVLRGAGSASDLNWSDIV
jgi:Ca2+-binding RTX toxin-like protein